MLHKAGKPKDIVGSYGPLRPLTSSLGNLFEETVGWVESSYKSKRQQNRFRKNRSTNDNLFKLFETTKFVFCKGHTTTSTFLDVEKAFHQVWFDGLLFKLTSMCLNRKSIRWITFSIRENLIISINNKLIDPITSIQWRSPGQPSFSLFFL